jgi:hypothetical protein
LRAFVVLETIVTLYRGWGFPESWDWVLWANECEQFAVINTAQKKAVKRIEFSPVLEGNSTAISNMLTYCELAAAFSASRV